MTFVSQLGKITMDNYFTLTCVSILDIIVLALVLSDLFGSVVAYNDPMQRTGAQIPGLTLFS